MPPTDRESRAAQTKAEVARRERLRKARIERERRRREAERARQRSRDREKAQRTPPAGRVEEDGSYRTKDGGVRDAETGEIRAPMVPASRYPTRLGSTADPKERKAQSEAYKRTQRLIARKRTGRDDDERTKPSSRLEVAGFAMPNTLLTRLAKDAEDVAVNLPGGLYETGKAVAGDVKDNPALAAGLAPGVALALIRDRPIAPRTTGLAKEIGQQYARDYRHPLRHAQNHPGLFALDAFAVASAGAGAAARGGAAVSAAKGARAAGSSTGIRSALTRSSAEGGSLLKKPLPGRRIHVYEGRKIAGRYSSNPLVRGAQRRADARTGGKNEIGVRKASRLLAEERRLTDAAERVQALKVYAESKGLTTPEQLAIQVVAEGLPLDDVIKGHLTMAANSKGKTRQRHGRRAALLETARPYLSVNSAGKPVFAKGYTNLAKVMRDAERAVTKRETGLSRAGLLSDEQIEYRRSAPGRVLLGARWEPRSLAEGSSQPFQLIGKRVRSRDGVRGVIVEVVGDEAVVRPWSKKAGGPFTASLDDLFPSGKTKQGRLVGGGRAIQFKRPRTLEEAEARLEKVEAEVNRTLDTMARAMAKGDLDLKLAADVSRIKPAGNRQTTNVVRRKHGMGVDILRTGENWEYVDRPGDGKAGGRAYTALELARKKAEERLIAMGKDPDAHPLVQKFNAAMDEVAALKTAIAQEREKGTFLEGLTDDAGGSLGEVTETRAMEAFAGGRFRVPESTLDKPWLMHRPQQYQGGVPRKPGTVVHGYTGALRRSGRSTNEPVRAIAEDALQAERYLSLERLRARIVPMGRDARPPDTRRQKWVPVRARELTKDESKSLREVLREVEIDKLSPDEAARLEAQIKAFENSIFPEGLRGVAPGTKVDGVVWVDQRLLAGQRKIIPGGRVPVYDEIADAAKLLILYLKPGYMSPNLLGNATLNIFQQGFLAPANWARATRGLPDDLKAFVDETMGQGFASALSAGTRSPISEGVQKAGSAWGIFVDKPFRRASFIHEARKKGYKSQAEMRALFTQPGKRADLVEIGQRARDAIVDYERLSPVEQDIVRRAIFVYPWLRGSTHYAVQFLRDHPIQAAVYGALGRDFAEGAGRELGPMPSYAEGSFKVGGSKEQPFLVNPRFVNPFETVQQIAGAGGGALGLKDPGRAERLGDSVHPIVKAGVETLWQRDLFTGQEIDVNALTPFDRVRRQLPQQQLFDRGRALGSEQEGKSRPVESWYDVAAPFVIGSAAPRRTNVDVLNKQAKDEGRRTVTPVQAVKSDYREERKAVMPAVRKVVDNADFKHIQRAYGIAERMDTLRARTRETTGSGEPYYRAVLEAEAKFMGKLGVFDRDDVDYLVELARKGSYADVKSKRAELVTGAYDDAYLATRRYAREQAGWSDG